MTARPSDATLGNGTPRASMGAPGMGFEVGSWVWSPCVRTGFRRSTIVSIDADSDNILVDARDETDPTGGGQERVRRSDVRPCFDSGNDRTHEDNTALVHLDDANILHNIFLRYNQDKIYTYTANVLLAVNPYKQLPQYYTEGLMNEYKNIHNIGIKSPHPYAIADTAYRQLVRTWSDQALIISGESGAGKTETAKITMRYLTDNSRTDAARGGKIQDRIINANPILESFGNAQTVRNRNSSRFGKYNEMNFDRVGSLVGAVIKTYLLESSRVVGQQEGEQNYHVFYQMLCGMSDDELDMLQLDRATRYKLLYPENSTVASGGSRSAQNSDDFQALRQALDIVGVGSEVQTEAFQIVAALLHLGEIQFDSLVGADGQTPAAPDSQAAGSELTLQPAPLVEIADHDGLAAAAELLGLSESKLLHVLKWRELHVASRRSRTRCPRTKAQSYQTLQSIVKILYKRLFDKIVESINASSAGKAGTRSSLARKSFLTEDGRPSVAQTDHCSIGTLDIYGFERLKVNSFEQLCINLANERLQQFFVEQVLDAEQKMYRNEMINVSAFELPDNEPVVRGINSVMSILDDHSRRFVKNLVKGDDCDQKFCENVHREHIGAPQDRRPATGPFMPLKLKASRSGTSLGLHDGFVVRHYAGEVSYSTKGWIEKNNDALVPEVESILRESSKPLVCSLAAPEATNEAGERFNSVSSKYLENLRELLATLAQSKLHYIRCFNPNEKRQAGVFDKKYVLDQVIQCGTVELVKIMHDGFPHRCKLEDIRNHFLRLLPPDFALYKDRDFVEAIMIAFGLPKSDWTVGTSRLFLKAGQLRVLENLLDSGSMASKEMIKSIRQQFARKKLRAALNAIKFALWLPRHWRMLRRTTLLTKVRWTCKIYVRLNRWLRKARRNLFGASPPRDVAMSQWRMQQTKLIYPLCGKVILQETPKVKPSQLFVALKQYDIQNYDQIVAGQADVAVLEEWQSKATESFLCLDGGMLTAVDFSPGTFLHHQNMASCLSPVRYVDVAGTGHVVQTREEASGSKKISAMCQSRRNTQLFATCHDEMVFVWKWVTGSANADPAICVKSTFIRQDKSILYGMCLLSDPPAHIKKEGGHVLLLLTGMPNRHWLTISIVTVYEIPNDWEIEFMFNVGEDGSFLEAAKRGELIFQLSHSERVLVVAGRGVASFYEIACTPKFSVELRKDWVQEADELNIVSCLCLPPPRNCARGALDWMIFGDATGSLFGSLWLSTHDNRMRMCDKNCGRFPSKQTTHKKGIPVSTLVATYGATSNAHHLAVQDSARRKVFSYGDFLQQVDCEKDRFFSLGDDGKLLHWSLGKDGWLAKGENWSKSLFDNGRPSTSGRQVLAAHSSRVAPNALVFVDQRTREFSCVDTRSSPESCSSSRPHGKGHGKGAAPVHPSSRRCTPPLEWPLDGHFARNTLPSAMGEARHTLLDIGKWGTHVDSVGIDLLRGQPPSAADAQHIIKALGASPGEFNCFLGDILGAQARQELMAIADDKHVDGQEDLKVNLSLKELEGVVGVEAVAELISLFAGRVDEIVIRRVEAGGERHVINFHTDYSLRTLQLVLNDEKEYDGGRLLYASKAGIQQPTRVAGSVTVHDNTIPHGVTEMVSGTRYGLFFLMKDQGFAKLGA